MKGNLLLKKGNEEPEKKEKVKWGKRKKILVILLSLIAVLAIVGGAWFFAFKKDNISEFPQSGMGMDGAFAVSEDMVGASGVISVGVTEEGFEVENLSTELIIEAVYVSSDEAIEAGTKILKLTEESVAEAREELEKTLTDAELAYRAGAIEYEQSKITAEYDYQTALLSGEQASEIYQETIVNLESSIERAEEELADAKEQIAEYQSYVNDSSYKSYFKVDEYQALYDENLAVLIEKMDEWGVSWEQVTGGAGPRDTYSYAGILASLYKVLEQNGKDLEQAQSDYEDAVANAAFALQTLELELPSLEQTVTEAREAYEIQVGQAKLDYEKSLANAERAQSDYETALEKAQSDYETLKSDYEDAKENLELFEDSVGDGYFYASGSGTILRVMVRTEQKLTSDSIIFTYSNPEEMSVSVSVDQTDIAKLAVGDEAYIQASSGEGYSGSITAINPVTSSDSRTSVTYTVTVTLSGDTSTLAANQSVAVIFGISADAVESMQNRGGEGDQAPGEEGVRGGDGQAPGEGEVRGEGGQAPGEEEVRGEGGQAPGEGEVRGEGGQAPERNKDSGEGAAE